VANAIPKFVVRDDANDISTQVRVQLITNGFIVRTGTDPIHYPDIESAAEAVKQGLLAASWPERNTTEKKK
jgi:hypothetical protein